MNKLRRSRQVTLRRNHPYCMHRKLCKDAQKTVHSNMLKNRNANDIRWLIFGMPVAIISETWDQRSGARDQGSENQMKKGAERI